MPEVKNCRGIQYQRIGVILKQIRETNNIRICALAEKANIPYQTLQGIENGHVKVPGFDIVDKIASALDVPLDTFRLERRLINENSQNASG